MSHLDNWTKAGRAGESDGQVGGELEACGDVVVGRVTHTFPEVLTQKDEGTYI